MHFASISLTFQINFKDPNLFLFALFILTFRAKGFFEHHPSVQAVKAFYSNPYKKVFSFILFYLKAKLSS